jgi:hypothetical protein
VGAGPPGRAWTPVVGEQGRGRGRGVFPQDGSGVVGGGGTNRWGGGGGCGRGIWGRIPRASTRRMKVCEGDDAVAVGKAVEERKEAVLAARDEGDDVEPGLGGLHVVGCLGFEKIQDAGN